MASSILGLAAVFFLVFINGFFVAAEFSLVGARRTRLLQLANEGNTGAAAAHRATEHLDSYIAATQLGITLASLGLGWIGEPAISHLLEPLLKRFLPAEVMETIGITIAIVISFGLVTLLHIVMGELVPKSIALQRPEGTSIIVSRPTSWFLAIFRPVIWLMNKIGNTIVSMLGFDTVEGHSRVHNAEELEMLVHASREAGYLQPGEEQMLRRVFDFGDLQVREIMMPRVDVDALPIDIAIADLLAYIKTEHHSRYPVFEKSIDHVLGVLHIKDVLDMLIENPALLNDTNAEFDMKSLLREAIYVPATGNVEQLLTQMQKTKIHLAMVIDEYGGMAGVVTLEDVLEELVGDMQDEFDIESESIIEEGNITLLEGLVSMSDVEERFGHNLEDSSAATIGGYIGEQLGRIPVEGDIVTFGKYTFSVREMDSLRVAVVEVLRQTGESDES